MSIFDPKPKEDFSGLTSQVEALTQSVKGLETSITEITNSVKILHNNQTQLSETIGGLKEGFTSNESHFQDVANEERIRSLSEYSEDELAMMNEQQKYRIQEEAANKQMRDAIQQALTPVGEQMKSVQQSAQDAAREQELRGLMTERGADGKLLRPYFNDVIPYMTELQKERGPNVLPFSDLYTLGKARFEERDPAGFTAVHEKHFPKPKSRQNMQDAYGGFLSQTLQETDEPGDMSIAEAAEAAAREVLENDGSLPGSDDVG
jgi:hypothetical protein